MDILIRELFAGRWMEGQTLDVEESIENGRSVGIVQVDLHSTLSDLRKEINRQIEEGGVPIDFSFVERLGKQLVEIWEEEESTLRVKDLVAEQGTEPEILIVEHSPEQDEDKGTSKKVTKKSRKKNLKERKQKNSKSRKAKSLERDDEKGQRRKRDMDGNPEDDLYSEDERRFSQKQPSKDKNRRNRRMSTSLERQAVEELISDESDLLDEEDKERIRRNRPKTVRIRKEERVTEEVDFGEKRGRPKIKNSILKRSESMEDLRANGSSPEGFLTADSATMDDYFLDRKPFSISELNLRDLGKRDSNQNRRRFEPSKMERRLSGLYGRIRNIQDKTQLLKNIGQEHWRGRFFQLRRNVAPLEERVKELENEDEDLQENLIGLFELRKPLRVGLYGEARKNNYILEAQRIRANINQLNTQLENIDLDLLKYQKMRDLTEKQIENLNRDIRREKFLRHLLIGRTLIT